MQNTDLGYDKENIVYFNATPELMASYKTLELKLLKNPAIESVGLSGMPMSNLYNFSNSLWHWPGQEPNMQTLFRCVYIGFNFS